MDDARNCGVAGWNATKVNIELIDDGTLTIMDNGLNTQACRHAAPDSAGKHPAAYWASGSGLQVDAACSFGHRTATKLPATILQPLG